MTRANVLFSEDLWQSQVLGLDQGAVIAGC